MNTIRAISWVLLMVFYAGAANAYKEQTHQELSENALYASGMLMDSTLLSSLGLNSLLDEFPDSSNNKQSIIALFRHGAHHEDDDPRALNHFFNPINGAPLNFLGAALGYPSPDWALEDRLTGLQNFSYRDARQSFFKALTEQKKDDRDKNFGLTFQTLGMIIHHIQDMAQPQHVRNDMHLDKWPLGGMNPLYNESLYEKFTNNNRGMLPYGGYPAVYSDAAPTSFNQPRYFWGKTTGAGLAQFINLNFTSACAHFDNPGMFALQSQEVQG